MIFDELGIDFSLLMNSAPQIIGAKTVASFSLRHHQI
jgi:hypothetical protein